MQKRLGAGQGSGQELSRMLETCTFHMVTSGFVHAMRGKNGGRIEGDRQVPVANKQGSAQWKEPLYLMP